MRNFVLGMILLFALGDACAAPGVVGVQDYGQVTGRVLDAMTNRPIPAALVSVGSLYTASADARGAFLLARVPVGDQTVTARAPGYTTADGGVTVMKDRTESVGYLRLVPLVHAAGQPTLAPPATPTPLASPTYAASAPPSPMPSGMSSMTPSAVPSPAPAMPSPPASTALPSPPASTALPSPPASPVSH